MRFQKWKVHFLRCLITRLLKQTSSHARSAHALCLYIFLVTPRRSVTSELICPPAMRYDTKLFISLLLSLSVKPNQVCIKLNNALA